MKLKNIAIVAHVDHGKTTLVDGLIKQSNTLRDREEITERVMDSGEIEKERGITITAKNCALYWKDFKINLLDTPGHADFGGEVERSLMMVDGVLLLVDAAEGPLPQTRFVLSKALERGIKIGVVINKIDRPDERIAEVISEIDDLFLDLATFLELTDYDLDIPYFYASAKNGFAKKTLEGPSENLHPLLDFMVSDFFPVPKVNPGQGFQFLVTNLGYSAYLGQQSIGRIQRGKIEKNKNYTLIGKDSSKNFKVTDIQIFDGLGTKEIQSAEAGEIVLISGIENVKIGDSICDVAFQEPIQRIEVDPPTVSVTVSVNTSPTSGTDGEYLTSRKLEEMLIEACNLNVALKYSPSEDPKEFELKGRGELQLAIVFEQIRRRGYEFMVARPQVLMKEEDGKLLEPFESAVVDLPSEAVGTITESFAKRKGLMKSLNPLGEHRTRLVFEVPSRGLIGYRSQFMNETKGEGIMSSRYIGHFPYCGDMLARQSGSLISDRAGKATPYALFNLLSSGKQFIVPGDPVYEGQVIGEHTRDNDLNINCVREKHLSSVRTAGKDENIILPPVKPMSIEFAMNWIDKDEWVEITPVQIRIRKKVIDKNKRSTVRR
jgi:GTP-binding protein